MYELYKKVDEDTTKFEKAIIYFDEIDKLSESFTNKGSVGGVEMQQEFLTILEDDELIIDLPKNHSETRVRLNSKNLMFIFSGSFAGIENIIEKRIAGHAKALGFGASEKQVITNLLHNVKSKDIIEFGIIPELIGRINFIETLDELTVEDIIKIMRETKDSPLVRYQNFFATHLDQLEITDEAYQLIAQEVINRGGGARSITSVLQELTEDFLYQAPNMIEETFKIDGTYFQTKFNH